MKDYVDQGKDLCFYPERKKMLFERFKADS